MWSLVLHEAEIMTNGTCRELKIRSFWSVVLERNGKGWLGRWNECWGCFEKANEAIFIEGYVATLTLMDVSCITTWWTARGNCGRKNERETTNWKKTIADTTWHGIMKDRDYTACERAAEDMDVWRQLSLVNGRRLTVVTGLFHSMCSCSLIHS